jgi:integrase
MARKTDQTGIRRHGAGWRASVSCGRGRSPVQRHFPIETPLSVMQEWRADTKASLRLTRKQRATAGTFAYDAARYLGAIRALTSYHTRCIDIARWVAIFGTRRRDTITAADIRHWRDRWMREPRSAHPSPSPVRGRGRDPKADEPYAASTINHWLRALSNLWSVLDGRRAPNPVRDVPEVTEPDALPRALDYALIERIISEISDRGRPVRGQKNTTVSLTKLRLRVLAYTGLTYAQLGGMTRDDVNLDDGSMLVRRRKKGKGAKPRRLGLVPIAVDAFRALDAADAWGPFAGGSVWLSFQIAFEKVRRHVKAETGQDLPPCRPYDLRHSYAAIVYRATQSREAVRELLSHATVKTTERYTLSAVDDVLRAHVGRVAASQNVTPDGK